MNNIELIPYPLDQDFLEKILEDLEIGLVVWREHKDSSVYNKRLKRIKKLEKYIKEQY
jgi:hypothetical protein